MVLMFWMRKKNYFKLSAPVDVSFFPQKSGRTPQAEYLVALCFKMQKTMWCHLDGTMPKTLPVFHSSRSKVFGNL